MGTDIHPAVEVRREGVWRYHRPKTECPYYWDYTYDKTTRDQVFTLDADGERVRSKWDRCKYRLPEAFWQRNYTKFAVLGDVRNGYGFAGVKTFEPLPAISDQRGLPDGISKEAQAQLSNEHSPGWVTLTELLDYNFANPLSENGVISEAEFLACVIERRDPKIWSGGVSGQNIVVLTPAEYLKLFGEDDSFGFRQSGSRKYDATKSYHIQYEWMVPLATAVPDVLEMIAYLKPLVPKGGTPDDVRVVFDFDS